MKLLLIEAPVDRPASMGDELRAMGYAVDEADDALQAVERAGLGDYDVILLDMTLPRDESLPILHEIRESNREVTILVLSDRDQIHDRVTALIQGADDFLVKPVSVAGLHARIRQLTTDGIDRQADKEIVKRPARKRQPNFRIGELLRFCESGDLELVISETPMAALLKRIEAGLEATALARGVDLLLPQSRLPTLLTDARWMEQLLANLIFNVMVHGKRGNCVELKVSSNCENCRIDIETGIGLAGDLSQAMQFARHMNLRIDQAVFDTDRFRISIGGIKIR